MGIEQTMQRTTMITNVASRWATRLAALASGQSDVGSYIVGAEFLARNLTLAIAVGIVMLWNFFVNRRWTYKDVR